MYYKFLWSLLSIYMTILPTSSILDADYYIQSVADRRLCIEGGAGAKGSLEKGLDVFHEGTLGTRLCQNILEQQWHCVKLGGEFEKSSSILYNVTSAAPELYISKALQAKIRGFFMKYWHNPIELIPLTKPEARWGFFTIKQRGQDYCFQSLGEGKVVGISHCDLNSLKQIWSFRLVTHGVV